MDGWIKIHRELLTKAIWKDGTAEQKAVLMTLLLLVNYEDKEWNFGGRHFSCKAGQTITSVRKLAKLAGVSVKSVRVALSKFEKLGFLTIEATKFESLVTICNWDEYQENDAESDQKRHEIGAQLRAHEGAQLRAHEGAQLEDLQKNNAQSVTDENNKIGAQLRAHEGAQLRAHEGALTKEYKEDKEYIYYQKERDKEKGDALNSARPPAQKIEEKTTSVNTSNLPEEKEKKVAPKKEKERANFKKPTTEEVQAYITEKGYGIDAEQFTDYYEANGWVVGKVKMKDWKATVRNWARRESSYKRVNTRTTEPININDRWND